MPLSESRKANPPEQGWLCRTGSFQGRFRAARSFDMASSNPVARTSKRPTRRSAKTVCLPKGTRLSPLHILYGRTTFSGLYIVAGPIGNLSDLTPRAAGHIGAAPMW